MSIDNNQYYIKYEYFLNIILRTHTQDIGNKIWYIFDVSDSPLLISKITCNICKLFHVNNSLMLIRKLWYNMSNV